MWGWHNQLWWTLARSMITKATASSAIRKTMGTNDTSMGAIRLHVQYIQSSFYHLLLWWTSSLSSFYMSLLWKTFKSDMNPCVETITEAIYSFPKSNPCAGVLGADDQREHLLSWVFFIPPNNEVILEEEALTGTIEGFQGRGGAFLQLLWLISMMDLTLTAVWGVRVDLFQCYFYTDFFLCHFF